MTGNPGLFDEPEGDGERAPSGFFQAASEAGERKGIGRPRGAINRKTEAFGNWYRARGFRDPLELLGELVTLDARSIRALLAEEAEKDKEGRAIGVPSLGEVFRMQIAAAGELAPYLHGKMPTVVQVEGALPVLAIMTGTNQLDEAAKIVEGRALSIGAPEPEAEPSEINGLEGGQ